MPNAELVALVAGREATIRNAMARFAAGTKDIKKATEEKTKDFRAFVGFVLHPPLLPTDLNLSTDQTFQSTKLFHSNSSANPKLQPTQLFNQPKLQPTKASTTQP
jgi:hypothetical protein